MDEDITFTESFHSSFHQSFEWFPGVDLSLWLTIVVGLLVCVALAAIVLWVL